MGDAFDVFVHNLPMKASNSDVTAWLRESFDGVLRVTRLSMAFAKVTFESAEAMARAVGASPVSWNNRLVRLDPWSQSKKGSAKKAAKKDEPGDDAPSEELRDSDEKSGDRGHDQVGNNNNNAVSSNNDSDGDTKRAVNEGGGAKGSKKRAGLLVVVDAENGGGNTQLHDPNPTVAALMTAAQRLYYLPVPLSLCLVRTGSVVHAKAEAVTTDEQVAAAFGKARKSSQKKVVFRARVVGGPTEVLLMASLTFELCGLGKTEDLRAAAAAALGDPKLKARDLSPGTALLEFSSVENARTALKNHSRLVLAGRQMRLRPPLQPQAAVAQLEAAVAPVEPVVRSVAPLSNEYPVASERIQRMERELAEDRQRLVALRREVDELERVVRALQATSRQGGTLGLVMCTLCSARNLPSYKFCCECGGQSLGLVPCARCQSLNFSNYTVCTNCGENREVGLGCPHCGAVNSENWRFCSECGTGRGAARCNVRGCKLGCV